MKHLLIKTALFTGLFMLQLSFAQKGTWLPVGKSFSFTIVSENNGDTVSDQDAIKAEIYSFPGMVENPDLTRKKPADVKTVLFKDLREKADAGATLNFKKNSVYILRLNEGIRGERFRLDIADHTDQKKTDELSRYLTSKITHGGIMTESIDTKGKKNKVTRLIISVTDENHFDFEALKNRFGHLISDISKVAAYKSTLFIKITT